MAIKQISIFIENKSGSILPVTTALAQVNVDMRALSIAETESFGILRIIVNDISAACSALDCIGAAYKLTDVIGVKISDKPGQLNAALDVLSRADVNIEYLYAFTTRTEHHAYTVFNTENSAYAEQKLIESGFDIVTQEDIDRL